MYRIIQKKLILSLPILLLLFREYIGQLMEYKKKFLIIGSQKSIGCKEIFPLFQENKIWWGYGFKGAAAHFFSPYEDTATAGDHKKDMIRVSSIWFTNLEIPKRSEEMDLVCRYCPDEYPRYENYNAIEVGKTTDIDLIIRNYGRTYYFFG